MSNKLERLEVSLKGNTCTTETTVSGTGMTATHPCGVFQSGSAFISFSAEL